MMFKPDKVCDSIQITLYWVSVLVKEKGKLNRIQPQIIFAIYIHFPHQ